MDAVQICLCKQNSGLKPRGGVNQVQNNSTLYTRHMNSTLCITRLILYRDMITELVQFIYVYPCTAMGMENQLRLTTYR